jgi:hypothetical protein
LAGRIENFPGAVEIVSGGTNAVAICFVGTARLSLLQEATAERKFRALSALGELSAIAFWTDARFDAFRQYARFRLLRPARRRCLALSALWRAAADRGEAPAATNPPSAARASGAGRPPTLRTASAIVPTIDGVTARTSLPGSRLHPGSAGPGAAVAGIFCWLQPYYYATGRVATWAKGYGAYTVAVLALGAVCAKMWGFLGIAGVSAVGVAVLTLLMAARAMARGARER